MWWLRGGAVVHVEADAGPGGVPGGCRGDGCDRQRVRVGVVHGDRGACVAAGAVRCTSAAFGSDFFTGTNQQRIMRSTFDSTGTNLAVFAFGANDYWYQPGGHTTSHNVTPTVFASNLQFGIDCVTNQNGKTVMTTPGCVLLVAGPRRATWDLGSAPTYTEQAYYDAMKAVAAANDHVAFLDMFESWGSNANASAAGLCGTGDVHPNRAGHGDIARVIHGALTSREVTAA
jgi:lysophospholipase L1-like esterase